MVRTVKYEMKDTLGIARPRKIPPVKEARERIEKSQKTIKQQVSEQIARENMKLIMPSHRSNEINAQLNPDIDQ